MTSQLVISRAFFFIYFLSPHDPRSEKKSCKSTKKSGLIDVIATLNVSILKIKVTYYAVQTVIGSMMTVKVAISMCSIMSKH